MKDLLLCKPGEIFLKGLNKHYFEERLVANVKRRLKPIGHFRVTYLQSALYIEAADDAADLDAAYDAVRKVFGIATITRAAACEKDKDAITALAKTYLHDAMTAARSFKVETKRSDKRFPMTSIISACAVSVCFRMASKAQTYLAENWTPFFPVIRLAIKSQPLRVRR